MKKLLTLFLAILIGVSMLAGCNNDSPPSQTPTPPQGDAPAAPSTLMVIFFNSTEYIFNEIYISPTAANDWGQELLGSTSVLKSNGSVDVEVPAYDYENYDIRVVDEDDYEYTFTYVPLLDGGEVAIYFDEERVLSADVYDLADNCVATVVGEMNGGGQPVDDQPIDDGGQGDVTPPAAPDPVVTGTGNDTNGQYSFEVYNESAYDIYSIHMGIVNSSASADLDILPQILPAGQNTVVTGIASQGDWLNTEWSLFITDVDGDTSVSYDSFNPWTIAYVDINWDSSIGGYVCEFSYSY